MNHTHRLIQKTSNFEDLVSLSFEGEKNAAYWDRELKGDFSEIVHKIVFEGNLIELEEEDLLKLELSPQGQLAREVLLQDLKLLSDHGASPSLNIIRQYERDDALPFFPTDVYSFHVDRSPIHVDTFLCCYYGQTSDILPNYQAIQKILLPDVRAELQKLHNGNEQEFEDFLTEYFFDLHYQPKPEAQIVSLKAGNLYRLATDQPGDKVLPCIHRAPEEKGQLRLLMIC